MISTLARGLEDFRVALLQISLPAIVATAYNWTIQTTEPVLFRTSSELFQFYSSGLLGYALLFIKDMYADLDRYRGLSK